MGVIPTASSLDKCVELSASSFARRRLSVVVTRNHFTEQVGFDGSILVTIPGGLRSPRLTATSNKGTFLSALMSLLTQQCMSQGRWRTAFSGVKALRYYPP